MYLYALTREITRTTVAIDLLESLSPDPVTVLRVHAERSPDYAQGDRAIRLQAIETRGHGEERVTLDAALSSRGAHAIRHYLTRTVRAEAAGDRTIEAADPAVSISYDKYLGFRLQAGDAAAWIASPRDETWRLLDQALMQAAMTCMRST